MKLEVRERNSISIAIDPIDCIFIGMREENWLPAQVGARLFGDRWALKVDFDLRALYRGSDGAFYVIKGLSADQATFDSLILQRVTRIKESEEDE